MARPRKVEKPKRRARGTGTIVVNVTTGRAYALDIRDASGHRESYDGIGLTVEERRANAERWLDRRVEARQRAQGLRVETLKQYVERWLWDTYHAAPPSTFATHRARLAHIEPIASVAVHEVEVEDVHRMTDVMLEAGLSVRYVRQVRTSLKSALQLLVPQVLLANPVGPYRRPLRLPKRRVKAWDEAPSLRFRADASRTRWGPLWSIAVLYGLRHHELRGLTWTDLNERTRELTVRNRKTHAERVITLVREQLDELLAWRDAPSSAEYTSAIWMFTARADRPMGKSTLSDEFVQVIAETNAAIVRRARADGMSQREAERRVLPPLTIHGLRHTAATQMLRRGVAVAKVAEILGHHSPSFTYAMYGWAVPSDQAVVDQAIAGLMGAAPEGAETGLPGELSDDGQHNGSIHIE